VLKLYCSISYLDVVCRGRAGTLKHGVSVVEGVLALRVVHRFINKGFVEAVFAYATDTDFTETHLTVDVAFFAKGTRHERFRIVGEVLSAEHALAMTKGKGDAFFPGTVLSCAVAE
jgi:hypothetical protein